MASIQKVSVPKPTVKPAAVKQPKIPGAKSTAITGKSTPGMGAYMNASKMPKQSGMRGAIGKMY